MTATCSIVSGSFDREVKCNLLSMIQSIPVVVIQWNLLQYELKSVHDEYYNLLHFVKTYCD